MIVGPKIVFSFRSLSNLVAIFRLFVITSLRDQLQLATGSKVEPPNASYSPAVVRSVSTRRDELGMSYR